MPRSETDRRTRCPADSTPRAIVPPSGEYFTALSSRLTSTWRSLTGSQTTRGTSVGVLARVAAQVDESGRGAARAAASGRHGGPGGARNRQRRGCAGAGGREHLRGGADGAGPRPIEVVPPTGGEPS